MMDGFAAFLTSVSSVLTAVISWIGTWLSELVSHPLTFVLLGLTVLVAGLGFFARLHRSL